MNISIKNDVMRRRKNNILDYEVNENCDKYQVVVVGMKNIHSMGLDIVLKLRLVVMDRD